jgi:membrane-associated phospholipid phosphatase
MLTLRTLGVAALAGFLAISCNRGTPPAPEPSGPALTVGAPDLPEAPPSLTPHTRVETTPPVQGVLEPTAGAWKPVLYVAPDDAVPAPPTGDALEADRRRAAELRAAPAAKWERTAQWWSAGAVRRWNEIARALIARYYVNSSFSARLLAALAVAQYDAVVAARRLADRYARETADPERLAAAGSGSIERHGYPSQEAAVARASAEVLASLFPPERAFVLQNEQAHGESRIWMGAAAPSDIEAGRTLGRAAAVAVVDWLQEDGAAQSDEGRVTRQPDKWFSEQQTLPGFGRTKPWVMRSGDQFRAPEPPAVGSPEFAAALAEIRAFSDRLSAEQLATAQYWNLGVGGISVPGMWDLFALELAAAAGYSEARTARTLALLNMAMMDASIASWESKFHYLVPRPSMRDPDIREPLGLPAHPSYTSGHSAFSGAAEGILAAIFPASAQEVHRLAEEASASRWYGGIHYRFDGDAGLAQGRNVAAWVLSERGASDGVPPFATPADHPTTP